MRLDLDPIVSDADVLTPDEERPAERSLDVPVTAAGGDVTHDPHDPHDPRDPHDLVTVPEETS